MINSNNSNNNHHHHINNNNHVITPRSVSNIFMNFDDLNEYATFSFTELIKYYLGKDDKYKELHPQT